MAHLRLSTGRNRHLLASAIAIVVASSGMAMLPTTALLASGLYQTSTTDKPKEAEKKDEAPKGPRPVDAEAASKWESIRSASISNDGRWLLANIGPFEGDNRILLRNNDSPERWETPNGQNASFSDDSKYAGMLVFPNRATVDKLVEQGQPTPSKLSIRSLPDGLETTWEDIRSFRFLKDSSKVVAVRAKSAPPAGPTAGPTAAPATDILLFDGSASPDDSTSHTVFPSARLFLTNKKETHALIEYTASSGYSTLVMYEIATGKTSTLYSGANRIVGPTWAEDSMSIAFAVAKSNPAKDGNQHVLMHFSQDPSGKWLKSILDPEKQTGFPDGMRISEAGGITLSKNGKVVALGLKTWTDRPKPTNPRDTATVEVWNTQDKIAVPMQKVQFGSLRNRTAPYVWTPTTKQLTPILTTKESNKPEGDGTVTLLGNFDKALIERTDINPASSGTDRLTLSVKDLATGKETEIANDLTTGFGGTGSSAADPTGRFIVFFRKDYWWLHSVADGKTVKLTPKGSKSFEDDLDDHTVPEKAPAGGPTFLQDEPIVLLDDGFDTYSVNLETLDSIRLTKGREQEIEHRLVKVDPYTQGFTRLPRYYFVYQDRETKQSGVFISDGKGGGKPVFQDEVVFGPIVKAKNADRVMFMLSSFEKSPNIYITNEEFSQAKPVTRTNPQQSQFLWGKSEVVQFKSRFGTKLQGTLIYPAGYDKTKKYPMVTYIYERLSQGAFRYRIPLERNAYDSAWLSQNGYFVFEPDIAYRGNRPGQNAVDCLEPAIEAVIKKNVGVDPKKIGLIGHSWGGYQTAFVTTVSERFAIGVAGAPLTELTSMYNSFYMNQGFPNPPLFERSQGRTGVPFWEDPSAYIDNSPVWQARRRKIPLLFAFGDEDGAVDWRQGQYLYNTFRRLGMNAVMLVYNGENHNNVRKPNQLDYAKRLRHYLDVYLKGVKPEKWITDGVPLVEQRGG